MHEFFIAQSRCRSDVLIDMPERSAIIMAMVKLHKHAQCHGVLRATGVLRLCINSLPLLTNSHPLGHDHSRVFHRKSDEADTSEVNKERIDWCSDPRETLTGLEYKPDLVDADNK